MKIVTIIQARMGSSRLPGKVLMDLGGKTVLARVFKRACGASLVHQTVIATTTLPADDLIVEECQRLGAVCSRGSEDNVLDRYYRTALANDAGIVVRVTSDNPLVDPDLIDEVISKILSSGADYADNRSPRSYPIGLDVEAFTMAALQKAWRESTRPDEREHVTPYLYQHPEIFDCVSVTGPFDCSHYRWTLDTTEDLCLIREIYSRLGNQDRFSWGEALAVMEAGTPLNWINSHVIQKSAV
jgi:spore coat polysaccharide biosynthesis protein SpsF